MIKPIINYSLVLCFFISTAVYATNDKTTRVFDTGEPIKIELSINHDTQLVFDWPIASIAIDTNTKDKIISQSIDKRWWIMAKQSFKKNKVLVKSVDGKVMVFIISATAQKALVDAYVVVSSKPTGTIKDVATYKKPTLFPYNTVVDLTRFAAQSLYAPKRLIKDIGLKRTTLSLKPSKPINLFTCTTNLLCQRLVSTAIASWSDTKRYVHAVEIKNISDKAINLDPRYIIGSFIATTFQFNRLGPAGSNVDTTVVYLVSNMSLQQSL